MLATFSRSVKTQAPVIEKELGLSNRLASVIEWLHTINEPSLAKYALSTRDHTAQLLLDWRGAGGDS